MTATQIATLIGGALFVMALLAFIQNPTKANFITAAQRGLPLL